MSGYFARLAAQVASPAVTPGARAKVSPSMFEQHAEVTAPMPAAAHARSLNEERPPSSSPGPLSMPQAQPPLDAAPMAQPVAPRTEAPADSLHLPNAMPWPVHLQPSKPALAASPLNHSHDEASAGKAFAPLTTAQTNTTSSPPRQPRSMPMPQAAPQLVKEAPSTLTSPNSLDLPWQKPAPQAQSQSLAWQAPEQAVSVASSFQVRPVQQDYQRESPPTITPSSPGETMPRTHVRIGTITLEVHAANPAPMITPEPQPVAEPTPAPARFALRRHHVRWS